MGPASERLRFNCGGCRYRQAHRRKRLALAWKIDYFCEKWKEACWSFHPVIVRRVREGQPNDMVDQIKQNWRDGRPLKIKRLSSHSSSNHSGCPLQAIWKSIDFVGTPALDFFGVKSGSSVEMHRFSRTPSVGELQLVGNAPTCACRQVSCILSSNVLQ